MSGHGAVTALPTTVAGPKKALEYDGLLEGPDWVFRWNDYEWGAKGIAHFYDPEHPLVTSRRIVDHMLDRLGIETELRAAWCESHADDVIVQEFLGEWPRSTPEGYRTRRLVCLPSSSSARWT